jgi:hypothetical protein
VKSYGERLRKCGTQQVRSTEAARLEGRDHGSKKKNRLDSNRPTHGKTWAETEGDAIGRTIYKLVDTLVEP